MSDFESEVLRQLSEVKASIGDMRSGLGEVKGELVGIQWRQDIANGRTAKVEAKVAAIETADAVAEGQRLVRADVLVTRSQVIKLGTLSTTVAALTGGIAAAVSRFFG
jgi:hypothetical protein